MSRLLDNGKEYRDEQLASNIYKEGKDYNSSHTRAKSDGDIHGKGENDGSIGSSDDIKTREKLLAMAKGVYKGSEYDSSKA